MRNSLLQDPQFSEIETKLNEGRLEDAQRLLAALPDVAGAESARVYFATRLLFERGRLDRNGVAERLRELLDTNLDFPEARRMLQAAEGGVLQAALPHAETAETSEARDAQPTDHASPPSSSTKTASLGSIPRAPPLPIFTLNHEVPSYSPARESEHMMGAEADPGLHHYDTELSPPPPPPSHTPQAAVLELDSPRPPPRVPRVPSLEFPAHRLVSTRPAPAELGSVYSTIPSPEPPPSSRRSLQSQRTSPSLSEIASALDRGRGTEALALAERAEPSPEISLLKARAFATLGDSERTEIELGKLLRAPLLEPCLRSAMARFLIELGFSDRALDQARRALAEDPKDAAARVTCAWALLRMAQREAEPSLTEEAEPLLFAVRLRDPKLTPLLPALRAWVSVQHGDPNRALSLAQSALSQDANQPDALAALAIASANLGLTREAQAALQKLLEVAPAHADALKAELQKVGLTARRIKRPWVASEASVAALFGDAETGLAHGRPELAILGFERACSDRLRALSRRGGAEAWPTLAQAAARLFTELPVLRHFAPYDCSVFSIERLAAAFDVLYGPSGHLGPGEDGSVLLAGAYVGESLRQAFGGEWQGTPDSPQSARVEAVGISVRPCERVAKSLRNREPLSFESPAHLHPGADPLGNSVPLSLVPPSPWDPEPWPALHRVSEIGRLLPQSVVGLYCAKVASRLDHSVSGVSAIDRYVALIAPSKAPPALDAGWARRVSVLLGAYLGEVLIRALGARWLDTERVDGPPAYRIALRDGSVTTPVARALDRLSGRRVGPLSEYVARIIGGRASLHPSGKTQPG